MATSRAISFRGILLHIQKNLNTEERENLVFLKDLPEKEEEESLLKMRNFWTYMLKRQRYSEDDPMELFNDLQLIGREDICIQAKQMHAQLMKYKQSNQEGTPQTSTVPEIPSSSDQMSPASPGSSSTNMTQGIVHQPLHPHLPGPATNTSPVLGPELNTSPITRPAVSNPPVHVPAPNTSQIPGQELNTFPHTGQAAYNFPVQTPGKTPPTHLAPESASNIHVSQVPRQAPDLTQGLGESPISLRHQPPPGSSPVSPHYHTPQLSLGGNTPGENQGLKSNEPLRTMDSNLVQRKGSPSNHGSADEEKSGQEISLPKSLHSRESEENHQRNVLYQGLQSSSSEAQQGPKSLKPLQKVPGGSVPLQGSADLGHLASGDSESVISVASSLKSKEPNGDGQSGTDTKQPMPLRSTPQPLRTRAPGGVSQLTSSQIHISEQAQGSSAEGVGNSKRTLQQPIQPASTTAKYTLEHPIQPASTNAKYTIEHPIQPASTPEHLMDNLVKNLVNLTLEEAENLASSVPQHHVIGQDDTVRDGPAAAASGANSLPVDVVTDSQSDDATFDGKQPLGAEGLISSLFHAIQPEENKKTITLRNYQKELAEPGVKGVNYVICAPTGSGKTITAAHICYKNMMRMKENNRETEFKAIFIVPTRHLKKQQRDGFQDIFIPGQVTSLAEGQLFSDAFGKGNVKVLMITAQVLVNALMQKDFKLTDASMLVFDECHHTTLNHPYNEIMRQYLKEKKAALTARGMPEDRWPVGCPNTYGRIPQVVGLTASVGTGTSDDAHSHIVTLCANLDSFGVKIVSKPENLAFLNECNKPPEKDLIMATPKRTHTLDSGRFIKILETVMEDIENNVLIKYHGDFENVKGISVYSPHRGTQEYENWIAKIRVHAELRFPDLEICANYLFHLNLGLLLYEDLRAVDALESIEIFKVQTKGREDELVAGRHCRLIYEKNLQELKDIASRENPLSNPKLLCLHELIKRVYTKEPGSIGIVLARTRFATYALLNFIKECEELQELTRPIQPVRIVGQSKETEQGQTLARQEAALNDFKSGRANLLVATDIIQEGLDIPACNVIIRYNFVSNEIGTVQSKGRARKEGSKCFLIVEKGSINESREQRNRERVIEMDRAIREANQLRQDEWHKEIRERQLSIIAKIEENDESKRIQQEKSKQVDVKLLCRKCEKFICKSSDLERRLSNYTCLDDEIKQRTRIIHTCFAEFRESRTIGIVKCLCGYQLGQALEFKRLHQWKPGYNLSPKSFYFMYNDDPNSKQVFAKWKKVDFPIATEE